MHAFGLLTHTESKSKKLLTTRTPMNSNNVRGWVGFLGREHEKVIDKCSRLPGPPRAAVYFRTPVRILAWFWPRLWILNPDPACESVAMIRMEDDGTGRGRLCVRTTQRALLPATTASFAEQNITATNGSSTISLRSVLCSAVQCG
eukprot:COSAG02_NODE_252_length_26996_cov_29.825607_23_plen_146_part_00